jgi:tetratricopeptide (TPR) repeat protein
MKRIIITIFILVSFQQIRALPVDSLQKYIKDGSALYGQDKYAEAIGVYNKVLNQGYESGVLYYNLGNAYYRLGKLGFSRLYYEKALKLLKNDDDLKHNLQLLRLKLVDKIKEPPKFILYRWRDALLDFFSMQFYSWMVVILFWLSILFAVIRLLLKKQYKLSGIENFHKILLTIFVFFLFIFMQKVYFVETNSSAVVIETSVTIYAEPNVHGTEVFVLHEGTKVKIERNSGNWYEIKLADGKSGWVENKKLEII